MVEEQTLEEIRYDCLGELGRSFANPYTISGPRHAVLHIQRDDNSAIVRANESRRARGVCRNCDCRRQADGLQRLLVTDERHLQRRVLGLHESRSAVVRCSRLCVI